MGQQHINVGTTANDGTGDQLRTAFMTIEANFTEVYGRLPSLSLHGIVAADGVTGLYRVATIADISFAGQPLGLATLDGGGKIPTSQLPATVLGALEYQGTWNASTNTPTIPAADSTNKGWYYKVATAGTTNVGGITDWGVGDWIVSDGVSWEHVKNTESVPSVAGLTGAITAAGLKAALSIAYGDISGLGTAAQKTAGAANGVATLDSGGKLTASQCPVFSKSFESAQQTITFGFAGLMTMAHGLGVKPRSIQLFLVNVTAELGYSVGDEVPIIASGDYAPTYSLGSGVKYDATNVYVFFATSGVSIMPWNNANTPTPFTAANWKLIVRAYA